MSTEKDSYSTLSDDVLAELSRKGKEQAFNELVLRYLGKISYIARKYSVRGYEHTDFVQEGLLGLLFAARSYRAGGSASFGSYAMLVAERRFISIIRRQTAQSRVPESAIVAFDILDTDIVDKTGNPEEELMLRDQLEQALKRLEKALSKREFAVYSLYRQGLSYNAIAEKLGVSVKAVDNALQRVRKKLGSFDMS